MQLAQPLLTVTKSVMLFAQRLEPAVLIAAAAVLCCVTAAQRSRVSGSPHSQTCAPRPVLTPTTNRTA